MAEDLEEVQDLEDVTTPVVEQSNADVIDENDSSPPGEATLPPERFRSETSQPAEVPEEPTFEPELLRSVGLTAEQAKQEFGSPEVLERALAWQARQFLQAGRPPQQRVAPNQPQAPPQQAAQPAKKFEVPMPADWDEDSKKALTAINDHYAQRLEALESSWKERVDRAENALGVLLEHGVSQTRNAFYEQFDNAVNGLGEKWSETFGKGTHRDLDPSTPAFANRAQLFEATQVINQGRKAQGLAPLPVDQVVQWGLRASFPQQLQTHATQQLQGKVRNRQGQFVARPTARKEKPLSAEERAEAVVGKILEARGVYTPNVPSEAMDSV